MQRQAAESGPAADAARRRHQTRARATGQTRTTTYNGRAYVTRTAAYASGAACAGCARHRHTPPVLAWAPRVPPPGVQRRHAPPSVLDDGAARGRGDASTSASTPPPACPAAAAPRATRAVIELDLPAHHTDRGWSAPTQIAARRRPADSRTPREVGHGRAALSPLDRRGCPARRRSRVGRLRRDARGHPARESPASPAGCARATRENHPARGRRRGGDSGRGSRARRAGSGRARRVRRTCRACPNSSWSRSSAATTGRAPRRTCHWTSRKKSVGDLGPRHTHMAREQKKTLTFCVRRALHGHG